MIYYKEMSEVINSIKIIIIIIIIIIINEEVKKRFCYDCLEVKYFTCKTHF